MFRFVLMVNKQGQTRLAQYYEHIQMDERCALEAEVIRKCLSRTETQCSFFEYRGYKVVYRRYASLFFIVGVEGEDENEWLAVNTVDFFNEINLLYGVIAEFCTAILLHDHGIGAGWDG